MDSDTRPLKTRILLLLTLSIVVLLLVSVATIYLFNQQYSLSKHYYDLKTLSQDITYYDEVLTMSAHAGVHSSDPKWETRHETFSDLLDDALEQAAQIDPKITQFINLTSAANARLIYYETRAFELARNGQQANALSILNSPDYQRDKNQFSEGIKIAVDEILSESKAALDGSQNNQVVVLSFVMIASFFLVLGLWFYLIRYLQLTDKVMEQLIRTDALSGLDNKRQFLNAITHEVNRAYREGNLIMLAIFDIDNFKKFNDSYGHPKGDDVISQIGLILKQHSLRSNESAYRIGGEEFAILSVCESEDTAKEKVRSILQRIHALDIPHIKNPPYNRVTISCGLAFSNFERNLSSDMLYRYADEALYLAKDSGKNTFKIHE